MKIAYVHGNLLDGPEPALLHGCNMQGRFGKGFAAAVAARYPAARHAYMEAHRNGGLRLGEVVHARCDPHLVMNAITQEFFGNARENGRVYVDYDAVEHAIASAVRLCRERGFASLAMPLIGAGLAGGSWRRIARVVEARTDGVAPVVYLLDGVVPTT